jgi:hypothetical protein
MFEFKYEENGGQQPDAASDYNNYHKPAITCLDVGAARPTKRETGLADAGIVGLDYS